MPLLNRVMGNDGTGGLSGLFAAAERRAMPYVILTVVCLVLFGAGLAALPPTDRDESRFMQATKQMVESGDYVHIRVQDEPRTKKPIGIYWLQAAAVKIADQSLNQPWVYRLPSAVAAWIAVLVICGAGISLFGPRAGLVAGLMTATLPLTAIEAHLAKTDAALLCFTTLAMTAVGRLYVIVAADPRATTPRIWAATFWVALGAAMLIKGPVVVLVAGATLVTLCVSDRTNALLHALRPLWGVPLSLLVLAPWLLTLADAGNGGFVTAAIRQDLLPKLIGGQESHGSLPGTYLGLMIFTAWPWSLAVPIALMAAWPARNTPALRFCFAWLVPAWLAFEAVPTKLPHYILPLMPAAALLVGATVQDGRRWRAMMMRPAGQVWRAVWVVVALALGGGVIWAARSYGAAMGPAVICAAVAALAGAALALAAGHLAPPITAAVLGLVGVTFCGTVIGGVIPRLDTIWIAPRLAAEAAKHRSQQPVILVGFHEPSAIFLIGTKTRLTDAAGAAALLIQRPGSLAFVDAPDLAAVEQGVTAAGGTVTLGATITGLNYVRGKTVALTAVTATVTAP